MPGVSIAKLARRNGINANMLFTWRHDRDPDRSCGG
ncbi:transposase [Paraburkholderia sp. RL17-383-BIF-A]